MRNSQIDSANQARYIGSLEKDSQMCDFYEIVVDGKTQYVYIPVDSKQSLDT